ncbi:MAG: SGNH/GDSL hydrolase family protein [Clostridia bacterium]|nr:SGNH/GDSL hydrolase family protein [Clostridia bacterium]
MSKIKILFIGNSHTYYNDMPAIAKDIFAAAGLDAEVTMLTQGGKCLDWHYEQKQTRFNILYGGYDYIVLQSRASNFDPESYLENGKKIYDEWISKTDSTPILYMVWSNKGKKKEQPALTEANVELAKYMNGRVAPAGEIWQTVLRRRPAPELYREDGNHATPTGSYLAAASIFYAITERRRALRVNEGDEPHTRLGIDEKTASAIHTIACRLSLAYNEKE